MSEYMKAPFTADDLNAWQRKLAGDAKAEIERLRAINADLLAALEGLLSVSDSAAWTENIGYMDDEITRARAAIAKAKP